MKKLITLLITTLVFTCLQGQPVPAEIWVITYQNLDTGVNVTSPYLAQTEFLALLTTIRDDATLEFYYLNDDPIAGIVRGIHGGIWHDYVMITDPDVTTEGDWTFEGNGIFKYVVSYTEDGVNKFAALNQAEVEALKNDPAITMLSDQPLWAEEIVATREIITVPGISYYIIQAP